MKEEWVIRLREQCRSANVPFFFKQWGGVRKSEAGRMLEERTYDDMPARPSREVLPHRARLAFIEEVIAWTADHGTVNAPMRDDKPIPASQPHLF